MADLSASNFSTTDASNNAASPNGWTPGVMLPSQVEPTMQATTGALKRFWERTNCQITTTGASGAYIYAPSNVSYPSSIVQGEIFGFYAHQNSAGGDTFKINGTNVLGPYNIYIATQQGIRQIKANEILNGQFCMMQYSSALAAVILLNPAAVSSSSPTFTGTVTMSGATAVTVPTPAQGDNSTNAATTAYLSAYYAPLASPPLTGTPTAPTAPSGTNNTQIATTAFATQLAYQAALPAQGGNSGKYTTTDGTNASWAYLVADPWMFYSLNMAMRASAFTQ